MKGAACNDPINATYGSTFGITAWNGSVYGFTHSGQIVQVSEVDGTSCLIRALPNDPWTGAGVSTATAP